MPSPKMPVLFIGHGSPENAIEDNEFTRNWRKLAAQIPKPKAILCISAHWLQEGTAETSMEHPRTIHDFYGFPQELYQIKYPAPGSAKFAKKIKECVKTVPVSFDHEWGLDHGTWSVLKHMYPKADIPVIQLSLDYQLPLEKIFWIGKELSVLRTQGVLIIGSGNLVHNLMMFHPTSKPYSWAIDFDNFVKKSIQDSNYDQLLNYNQHPHAILAHPTNDHYLPLIYVLGAAEKEKAQFFNEKIVYGSISMRCVAFGMEKLKG
ncbi:MAG TPA: 4,5-DOPA dioxygenase extradiol [Candidatus Nanoarchaeia archaeon]|nr:4,5-DOPA dioxygenase extradiol [Candidatus Nanoarchaeia archaeon]